MLNEELIKRISGIIPPERLMRDEPMSRHTSFRIGGPAALFVQVNNEEELRGVLDLLCRHGGCDDDSKSITDAAGRDANNADNADNANNANTADFILIGNGSNLLVSDEGYPGIVVKLGGDFEDIAVDADDECVVRVGAARRLSSVSAYLTERGLSGFEFASGIPGSIGGAVFMNAGAYGGEMKDIVKSVSVMPMGRLSRRVHDGADCLSESRGDDMSFCTYTMSNEEMNFAYRSSRAQTGDFVILSVTLELKKDNPALIAERVSELAAKRNAKQPVNYPSAGSTFKRPAGGYAAALIEEAGLKGYRAGGACVSEKHSGFVINDGGASCEDVLNVMRHVSKTVYEKSGIMLEPEVRLINCKL